MNFHNNTEFDLPTIDRLTVIKHGKNNWRGRDITLFEHPNNEDRLISVGVPFDKSRTIICDDLRADWHRELTQPGNFITD